MINRQNKEFGKLSTNYKEIVKDNNDIQLKEIEEIASQENILWFKKIFSSEKSITEKLDTYERVQKNSDRLLLQNARISVSNSDGMYYINRCEQYKYIANQIEEKLDGWSKEKNLSLENGDKLKNKFSTLVKNQQENIDESIYQTKEIYVSLQILNNQNNIKRNLNKEDLETLKIPTEYLILKAMHPTSINKEVLASNAVDKINSLRKDDKKDSILKK